jgi:hypothetical protein
MKALLGVFAGFVALAGFFNFFASVNGQSPIPIGISHPLAMLAMAYLLFQHIFPAAIYRGGPEARMQAVQAVQATGTVLAKTSCGGYIGRLQFRGPLLGVEVYPGGISFKPILMPAAAILNHEVSTVQLQKVWFSEMVEIQHTSQSIASPIQLACSPGNPVREMLISRFRSSASS